MEHSEARLAAAPASKQGEETGKTGFDGRAAARKLLDISEEWRDTESKKNAVTLLRCLCEMTAESPAQGNSGFTNQELAKCLVRGGARASVWGVDSHGKIVDSDSARKAVTSAWKDLQELWVRKSPGVEERFRDAGWTCFPRPDSEIGGGRSNPTKYVIRLDAISEPDDTPEHQASALNPLAVRYYTEDLRVRRGAGAGLIKGFPISGWRAVVAGALIFVVVALMAIAAWAALASIAQASTTGQAVAVVLVSVLGGGLSWWVLGPLEKLSRNRVALAPFWMQRATSGWDDRLLELRPDFARGLNRLYLIHYSASCPICSSPVHVAAGGREFYGRLVGRCAAAPSEHVFSFDHVTRTGLPLRRHSHL
ncbi:MULTISPECIES: hypothetical protein [unclassified Thioalkalivibrio]|uniref:hypothetical protein n=1 Tax=unclassified Thioalkalivibrio TaxID=2621013 RepID=UPI0009DA67EA|nr:MULTISPECIES: hypothetical protein [unclassified Thioalkalivibrio]